jgi:hypothetical protein
MLAVLIRHVVGRPVTYQEFAACFWLKQTTKGQTLQLHKDQWEELLGEQPELQ